MDHVQISVEEYNKLRDFYLEQTSKSCYFIRVKIPFWHSESHQQYWKEHWVDPSTISEELNKSIKQMEGVESEVFGKLNKIPRWVRRIFKAL